MRKTSAAALVTAAAAAATLGLGVAPAFAAPWTISGNTNADGHYNGTAGTTTLKDTTTGTVLTCTSATATGQLANGTYTTNAVGTVSATTFTSCTGPLGLTFNVTQVGTWTVNALSSAGGGVTNGSITGVGATISGPGCSASVTGSVTGTYTNGTAKLAVNSGGLTISGVSGCLGLIKNGDASTFTATYSIAPSTIAIN